jgi:hypothetical protein
VLGVNTKKLTTTQNNRNKPKPFMILLPFSIFCLPFSDGCHQNGVCYHLPPPYTPDPTLLTDTMSNLYFFHPAKQILVLIQKDPSPSNHLL